MYRSLIIASPTLITAEVISSWLETGNEIAEVWCCEPDSPFLRPPKSLAGKIFPEFDSIRILQRAGVNVRLCPPLKHWAGACSAARATGADVLVTLQTLNIVPQEVLSVFGDHAINFHPSLLPGYRGSAPRQGMLLDDAADEFGGITMHCLTEGIDEGPIIAQRRCPASDASNMFEWDHMIARSAASMVELELPAFLNGNLRAQDQVPGSGSYRRVSQTEKVLTSALTLEDLEKRFRGVGRYFAMSWADKAGEKPQAVTGIYSHIGPPTGTPAKTTSLFLEVDICDARIRLRRKSVLYQLSRVVARLSAMQRWRRKKSIQGVNNA
jgi:methionyl-tRNA formyltransferase